MVRYKLSDVMHVVAIMVVRSFGVNFTRWSQLGLLSWEVSSSESVVYIGRLAFKRYQLPDCSNECQLYGPYNMGISDDKRGSIRAARSGTADSSSACSILSTTVSMDDKFDMLVTDFRHRHRTSKKRHQYNNSATNTLKLLVFDFNQSECNS